MVVLCCLDAVYILFSALTLSEKGGLQMKKIKNTPFQMPVAGSFCIYTTNSLKYFFRNNKSYCGKEFTDNSYNRGRIMEDLPALGKVHRILA